MGVIKDDVISNCVLFLEGVSCKHETVPLGFIANFWSIKASRVEEVLDSVVLV